MDGKRWFCFKIKESNSKLFLNYYYSKFLFLISNAWKNNYFRLKKNKPASFILFPLNISCSLSNSLIYFNTICFIPLLLPFLQDFADCNKCFQSAPTFVQCGPVICFKLCSGHMDSLLLLILIRDSQGRLLSKQTPPLLSHPSRALIVLKNPWHSAEAVLNFFSYLYRSNGKTLRCLVFGLEWPDHWLYSLCFFQQVRNTDMGMYFYPSCSFGGYGCISMQPNKGKLGPLGGFFFIDDVRYLWWR